MWMFLLACSPALGPLSPRTVAWSPGPPDLGPGPRGQQWARAIVHLHSPFSHDACDGHGWVDGQVDLDCLSDLRSGLCASGIDVAFLTDHPAHAAEQEFVDLFHHEPGDTWVEGEAGEPLGSWIACDDGRRVLTLAGIEDDLMPLALDGHVAGDPIENDRLYNASDAEAFAALQGAGASVFVAHTEGRDLELLMAHQDEGLVGLEIFNLHASFDPQIRGDDLGLDPLGWASEIAPFTSPDGTGEPDLYVLPVLSAQAPSVAAFDALSARGAVTAVAGTDAHQNVLPLVLRDGDRGDSYRRMLRWFSNWLLVDGIPDRATTTEALSSGRSFAVFEILGTPAGLDLHHRDPQGQIREVGGEVGPGTLVVGCPWLHPASPTGDLSPDIAVEILRDGMPWRSGCGEHLTDGPGVYRVRVDIVPHHLVPFLGDDPAPFLRTYPWIYSNAVRVADGS